MKTMNMDKRSNADGETNMGENNKFNFVFDKTKSTQ